MIPLILSGFASLFSTTLFILTTDAWCRIYNFMLTIKKKKEFEERQQPNSSETLEKLKREIVLLSSERDELNKRILQLTEQVNALEGENTVNERKQY